MPEFNINFDPEDVDPRFQETDTPTPAQPSDAAQRTSQLIRAMVRLMNDSRPEGITAVDITSILAQMMMQLRLFYTQEEAHQVLHVLFVIAEESVHSQEWVSADTGKSVPPPFLAEQIRNNPDGSDMLEELQTGVTDEALREMLDGSK